MNKFMLTVAAVSGGCIALYPLSHFLGTMGLIVFVLVCIIEWKF